MGVSAYGTLKMRTEKCFKSSNCPKITVHSKRVELVPTVLHSFTSGLRHTLTMLPFSPSFRHTLTTMLPFSPGFPQTLTLLVAHQAAFSHTLTFMFAHGRSFPHIVTVVLAQRPGFPQTLTLVLAHLLGDVPRDESLFE